LELAPERRSRTGSRGVIDDTKLDVRRTSSLLAKLPLAGGMMADLTTTLANQIKLGSKPQYLKAQK
jgi:hypothetical protein